MMITGRAWHAGPTPASNRRQGSGAHGAGLLKPIRAFTLIELLVVAAILAVLAGILLPSLGAARAQTRAVVCAAHLRELGAAFHMYANEHQGAAMPLAYPAAAGEPAHYWWGTNDPAWPDYTKGFLWPYLQSELRENGLYECPAQFWGSYAGQGAAGAVTTTYGYNGYYLCPPFTPGWSAQIGRRPWQSLERLRDPARLFVFGDTLIAMAGGSSNSLLDPPKLYSGPGRWRVNADPTTCFRHRSRTQAALADGHVQAFDASAGRIIHPQHRIGSVTLSNDPYYVPDWRDW